MMKYLKSRKFWAALAAATAAGAAATAGEIAWATAIQTIVAAAITYIASVAYEDVGRAQAGSSDK